MKILETHMRRRGMILNQILREGMVAIYEQSIEDGIRKILVAYEVIEIKERPDTMFGDRKVEAHEKYPADSEWGKTGWSFMTMQHPERALKRAKEKFTEVLEKIKER